MRHLEDDLQESCFTWFRYQYPQYDKLFFAVPNGGKRNAKEAARFKKQGVTPGVSDTIFLKPIGKYHGLCVELKIGNGKQSEEQIKFQCDVEAEGYKYFIAKTLEQFIYIIKTYLNNGFN